MHTNSKQLDELLRVATIPPAVNQVECHPLLPQTKLRDFCAARGIALTAYSPLGSPDAPRREAGDPTLLGDARIAAIGAACGGMSAAQVLVRFQACMLVCMACAWHVYTQALVRFQAPRGLEHAPPMHACTRACSCAWRVHGMHAGALPDAARHRMRPQVEDGGLPAAGMCMSCSNMHPLHVYTCASS